MALLLATAAAQPAPAPSPVYRIAGTVVNAATGEPVRRASVAALSASDHNIIESAETDSDGRFALWGLAAAKYELTASKRGFLNAFYDEHNGGYNTAIVTGEDQHTEGLIMRMTPIASLHGVVTDDSGDPVENAKVLLYLKPRSHNPGARITQVAETTTDDTGAYHFGGLDPGEYLLAVKAEPWYAMHHSAAGSRQRPQDQTSIKLDVAYPITYFDSTTDEASATPIVITGGSREEANINLRAVPALHLIFETTAKQVDYPPRAELHQIIFGSLASIDTITSQSAMQSVKAEFTGVAPGHYELTQGDPPRIAELDATVSQQLDPNFGKPAMVISGTLRTSSGAALPDKLTLSLESIEGVHQQEQNQVSGSNGQFTFESVRQGNYEFTASTPDKQLPIISITINGRTHPGNQITVSDQPMKIGAMVSLSETRIEGFARKGEKGAPGVMVVLVPKEPEVFPALARRDQSDSDGSFALRDVAPGQYTLVAIEDGWELDWARPEVISRYLSGGIAVTVTESSGKLVRLPEAVPVESR
jgi:protocatechuate 3,4-dioxygenase beta subunit